MSISLEEAIKSFVAQGSTITYPTVIFNHADERIDKIVFPPLHATPFKDAKDYIEYYGPELLDMYGQFKCRVEKLGMFYKINLLEEGYGYELKSMYTSGNAFKVGGFTRMHEVLLELIRKVTNEAALIASTAETLDKMKSLTSVSFEFNDTTAGYGKAFTLDSGEAVKLCQIKFAQFVYKLKSLCEENENLDLKVELIQDDISGKIAIIVNSDDATINELQHAVLSETLDPDELLNKISVDPRLCLDSLYKAIEYHLSSFDLRHRIKHQRASIVKITDTFTALNKRLAIGAVIK